MPNTSNNSQSIDNDYDDWANVPFERLMWLFSISTENHIYYCIVIIAKYNLWLVTNKSHHKQLVEHYQIQSTVRLLAGYYRAKQFNSMILHGKLQNIYLLIRIYNYAFTSRFMNICYFSDNIGVYLLCFYKNKLTKIRLLIFIIFVIWWRHIMRLSNHVTLYLSSFLRIIFLVISVVCIGIIFIDYLLFVVR